MKWPLEPGATLKQYRIIRLLGRGGMGEVYEAEDTRLGRRVAIKSLPDGLARHEDQMLRFTQEARAASALNHPSILTIHDVDEVDGRPFLVTELIEGETLRDRLKRGALPLREAIEIAGQVAAALAAAHAAGIVHRDVKPENIMLREDGHAKLLDFGLARIERERTSSSADETVAVVSPRTAPGIVMGTTAYMSPEQARGLPVDARSDIFSLGVVLYEMAAGRPPFDGETPSDVIAAILRFDPPGVAGLPPDLELTVRKALEKDREERTQTAKDLAADLKRLRRRLDPAAGSAAVSGHGVAGWTTTPKSGGTAANTPAPPVSSTPAAIPATAATAATAATTSRRKRLLIAAAAAVVIGTAAIATPLLGGAIARWVQQPGEADANTSGMSSGTMTVERLTGLGNVGMPTLSPDGKLLAYIRNDAGELSIWLRQLATGSAVRVVGPTPNNVSDLQFTPDGNLIYFNENTRLRPIRYTLKSVPAFGGMTRDVADGRFSRPSFSPDGARLVARRDTPEAWQIVVMNADGSGTASVIASRPRSEPEYGEPVWSPSGRYVATVVATVADNSFETTIEIMRPDGSERRTVRPAGMTIYPDLAWTATDAALLTIGTPRLGDPPQVFSVAAADGRVEQITNDVRRYQTLSFSPATGTIATLTFTSLGGIWVGPVDRPEAATAVSGRLSDMDGAAGLAWLDNERLLLVRDGGTLWSMHADGTNATRLSDQSRVYGLSVDRDGSQAVFLGVADGDKLPDVFRMTLTDRRVTRVTREPLGVLLATLSPDGRTVLYTPAGVRPARLMRVAAEGGAATSIFEAAEIFGFAASPDGTQVAVVANSGVGTPRTVNLVPSAAGSPRTIFSSPVALAAVRWYPKGDALLLSSISPQPNLYRLDVASGQLRQLTKAADGMSLGNPVISPDGRRIAYFRGTEEPDIVLLKP